MNIELLMLHGAKYAVLQMLDKGSCSYAERVDGGQWKTVYWDDICNYLTDMIDNYEVECER